MKILHGGRAIIVGVEPVNLNEFPDLLVIGCPMTGLDHIDLSECKRRDIKVISLQGETEFLQDITSTAEHTIGLLISLLRNYKTALRGPYSDRNAYRGHTLRGKCLGLLGGAGRVGQQVTRFAMSLGMDVVWYDTKLGYGNLDEVLRNSDVLSLHVPLVGNEGFFPRFWFAAMKPTAYLLNTSRDAVIEKGALLRALENEMIAGAAVDFTDDPELVEYAETHRNLILTNHIGGCTFEDMEATEQFITRKVERYLIENKLI